MKKLITYFILFGTFHFTAQEFKVIEPLEKWDTIPRGKAVIYGSFVQRLEKNSITFPQNIQLINTDTKVLYRMNVKPKNSVAKENHFIYVIPPGKYALQNYFFTESLPYGARTHTENIYALSDPEEAELFEDASAEKGTNHHIILEITGRTLNYIGVWDFSSFNVSVRTQKEDADLKFKKKYKQLNFDVAQTVLPTPVAGVSDPYLPTGYNNKPVTPQEIQMNREVENRYPNIAPFYGRVRKTLLMKLNDQKFVEGVLLECSCNRPQASVIFSEKAWIYFDQGDNEMASKRFNQAWLLDSLNYSLYWGFGAILGSQRRYAEAISFFNRAFELKEIKTDSSYAKLCLDFSITLCGRFTQEKEEAYATQALDFCKQAELILPNLAKVHFDRSVILYNLKRYNEAIASYEKSVSIDAGYRDDSFENKLRKLISEKK